MSPEGRTLTLFHDHRRCYEQIARFSRRAAEAYPRWEQWLGRMADIVWSVFTQVPPRLGSLKVRDLLSTAEMAWRVRGLGGLADACRGTAEARGVRIRTGADVAEIASAGGRVQGVVLADGEELAAPAVVSTIHPELTFLALLDPESLPPDFVADIRRFKCRGGAVKMNLATARLRRFPGAEEGAAAGGVGEYHHGSIELAVSPDYVQAAFDDAAAGRPAAHPIADVTIPSASDPTLMSEGLHCVSIYFQRVPHAWHNDPHRDEIEAFADRVIAALEDSAPGFGEAVLARQVLGPWDMESELGLVGGNVYGGELTIDQLFHLRPATGFADYRSPVEGLYNGSAGAHGGGGVSGIHGWQAARQATHDARCCGAQPRRTFA